MKQGGPIAWVGEDRFPLFQLYGEYLDVDPAEVKESPSSPHQVALE